MNCCGNNRLAWVREEGQREPAASPGPSPVREVKTVYFKYAGSTALTAIGPITGRRYRFSAPGAVIGVDARDAAALLAVPHLKRVRS